MKINCFDNATCSAQRKGRSFFLPSFFVFFHLCGCVLSCPRRQWRFTGRASVQETFSSSSTWPRFSEDYRAGVRLGHGEQNVVRNLTFPTLSSGAGHSSSLPLQLATARAAKARSTRDTSANQAQQRSTKKRNSKARIERYMHFLAVVCAPTRAVALERARPFALPLGREPSAMDGFFCFMPSFSLTNGAVFSLPTAHFRCQGKVRSGLHVDSARAQLSRTDATSGSEDMNLLPAQGAGQGLTSSCPK